MLTIATGLVKARVKVLAKARARARVAGTASAGALSRAPPSALPRAPTRVTLFIQTEFLRHNYGLCFRKRTLESSI